MKFNDKHFMKLYHIIWATRGIKVNNVHSRFHITASGRSSDRDEKTDRFVALINPYYYGHYGKSKLMMIMIGRNVKLGKAWK